MSNDSAPRAGIASSYADMYDFSILRSLRKRENLSIADLSHRSGVSPAVISKLERNQTRAELDTIYRLARVFSINPSELISLAERRTAQRVRETRHTSSGFRFREITFGNVRCLLGEAEAGSTVSRPKIHRDDYEVCWVVDGKLKFYLPGETLELEAGDAIQFDALLEHTYNAATDCRILITHIKKAKRY